MLTQYFQPGIKSQPGYMSGIVDYIQLPGLSQLSMLRPACLTSTKIPVFAGYPYFYAKGDGMAQMFQMMNMARMETGHIALSCHCLQ